MSISIYTIVVTCLFSNNVVLWQIKTAASWSAIGRAWPAGQRAWSFSPAQRCWEISGVLGPVHGLPGTRQTWTHSGWGVQQRVTKVMKRPEHLSSEKRLGQMGPLSLEKTRLKGGILLGCTNIWREDVKQTEPGSPQWCPVAWPEAMNTNWNTWGSVKVSGNTSSLWEWPNIGTGCTERLWSFYLWRYSRATGTQSWATGRSWPCLSQEVGQGGIQRSFSASINLWSCSKIALSYTLTGKKIQRF